MSFFSSAPVPKPPATDEERQALIEQQRANQQRRLMHNTEFANMAGPPYAPQYLNTGFYPLLTVQQVQEFTAASSSAAGLSGFSSAPSAMSLSPAPPDTQSSTSTTHQPSGFVFNPSVPAPAPTSQASMQLHPLSSDASAAGRPLFPEWTADVPGRRRRETTFPEFAHAPTGHYQFPAAPLPDPAAAGIPGGGGGALAGNAAASSLNHMALMSLQSGWTPLTGQLPTFVPPWAFNSAAAAPATAPTSSTDNPRPMSSGNSAALPATSASDRAARSEEEFLHMQSELAFNPFLYQGWATWDHRRWSLDPSAYFHQQHAPNASTAPIVSDLLPGQQQLVQLGKVALEEYNATRIVPKTPYNDLFPNGQPKGPNYFVPPEKQKKKQEEIQVRKKTKIAQALLQEEIKKKVPKFTSSGEERDAPRKCTNCKKPAHDRRNCPLPRFEAGREIFASRSCTLCGSTEHDKRTCDKKEKETSLPSAPPSRGRAAAPRGRGADVALVMSKGVPGAHNPRLFVTGSSPAPASSRNSTKASSWSAPKAAVALQNPPPAPEARSARGARVPHRLECSSSTDQSQSSQMDVVNNDFAQRQQQPVIVMQYPMQPMQYHLMRGPQVQSLQEAAAMQQQHEQLTPAAAYFDAPSRPLHQPSGVWDPPGSVSFGGQAKKIPSHNNGDNDNDAELLMALHAGESSTRVARVTEESSHSNTCL